MALIQNKPKLPTLPYIAMDNLVTLVSLTTRYQYQLNCVSFGRELRGGACNSPFTLTQMYICMYTVSSGYQAPLPKSQLVVKFGNFLCCSNEIQPGEVSRAFNIRIRCAIMGSDQRPIFLTRQCSTLHCKTCKWLASIKTW